MKILVITALFSCEKLNDGLYTVVYDFLKYLNRDNEIVVIVPIRNNQKHDEVYLCDRMKVYPIEAYYDFPGERFLLGNLIGRRIRRKMENIGFEPDICIVHLPADVITFLPGLKLDCDVVGILHRTDLDYLQYEQGRFSNSYLKNKIISKHIRCYENSFDRMYCRSHKLYEEMNGYYSFGNLQSDIIYSGISTNNHVIRKEFIRNNEKLRVVYVGSLIEQKGVQDIIKAISSDGLKEKIELSIVGDGEYKDTLVGETELYKIADIVEFTGKKTKEEVSKIMALSDVFIMTSLHETLGLVYLEAMAAGCIVVGSKGEGIDGVIKDGINGFLVTPRNIEEIREVLIKIINLSEKELGMISKNALQYANEHTEEKAAENYFELICGK